MTEEERREAARDMGVALELAAQNLLAAPPLARLAAAQAVPLLEAAVRDRPDDLRARESLGYALGMLDRLAEARSVYEEVLRIEPSRELALPYLARTLAGLRRPDLAAAAFRERDRRQSLAVGLSPDAGPELCPGAGLARCGGGLPRGDPAQPRAVGGAVAAGPGLPRAGEPAKADAEFQILLRFYPADRETWQQWYEQQKKAGPGASGRASIGQP